ncbi:MAG TPA: hypothetical protein VLG71_02800, partial [Candidatus Limnocylindria bacterium]|nr:hypothetical protein [Candidatus Limnocylindria bacterium]
MLFLPRHNKFYAAIVPIKPLYRYALTLFITGALGYGWLYGIYQPLQAKLQQQTVEIAVLEQQYATRSELNNNLVALQTTVSNLQKALGTYNHKAHDDGSFP